MGFVGRDATGTLKITNGSAVRDEYGYVGCSAGSSGEVTVDGAGSTWTNSRSPLVGYRGRGTLRITNGGAVSDVNGFIGCFSESTGEVTVDGDESAWTNSRGLAVGDRGRGKLRIIKGGAVGNVNGFIGCFPGSTGVVTVDGADSTWTNRDDLLVGRDGSGTLYITGGGLVSVGRTLTIDFDGGGDGLVNMAAGGMLALDGDADDSLAAFLDLVRGTDAIRYWDAGMSDWADITTASYGTDYTLSYRTDGDLSGYTVLTVFPVPEPAALGLLAVGGVVMGLRRRGVRPVAGRGERGGDQSPNPPVPTAPTLRFDFRAGAALPRPEEPGVVLTARRALL